MAVHGRLFEIVCLSRGGSQDAAKFLKYQRCDKESFEGNIRDSVAPWMDDWVGCCLIARDRLTALVAN